MLPNFPNRACVQRKNNVIPFLKFGSNRAHFVFKMTEALQLDASSRQYLQEFGRVTLPALNIDPVLRTCLAKQIYWPYLFMQIHEGLLSERTQGLLKVSQHGPVQVWLYMFFTFLHKKMARKFVQARA